MIVRWCVIVLTLLGAVPVRICTCGAAHHNHSAPVSPRETEREPPVECPTCIPEPAGEHHDADCHAIKPRPLMSLGLQCDVTDVPPADAIVHVFADIPPIETIGGRPVPAAHPPPHRPLFITLSTLRN